MSDIYELDIHCVYLHYSGRNCNIFYQGQPFAFFDFGGVKTFLQEILARGSLYVIAGF